jgi:glycosyltransferase involved in cell wall biosynthesis
MRILLVNDFFSPYIVGGAETLVQTLIDGLQSRGHVVGIATARIGNLPAQDTGAQFPIFRLGRFPSIKRAREIASGTAPGRLSAATIIDFQAAIAAFRPDIIHFHNIWLLGPKIVHYATTRKGITLHDYWPICVRRTMIHVNWQPCSGPSVLHCRICRLRAPSTLRSLDLLHIEQERTGHADILAGCDFVTAPSKFLAKQIAHAIHFEPRVIYNGVDTQIAPIPLAEEPPYVLFASRPVATKGYDVALSAFARPELQGYELRIAGAAAAVHAPNVKVLGQQPPSQMHALIAQASCVIVPSIWPENCPMIILEALRAGVPVVASDIGGIPELIEDGLTGMLVVPGDSSALAAAVRRSCEDQCLRQYARERGPAAVCDRFSRENMLSQLEVLYAA